MISNGQIAPRPSDILTNLNAIQLDYDVITEISELYGMGSYYAANKQFCDSMLELNSIIAGYKSLHSSTATALTQASLNEVEEILQKMEVDKIKVGGLLSKIPVLNVLYSYDIRCFAARLKIYSEDLVDCHASVKRLGKTSLANQNGAVALRKKTQGLLATLISFRAAYEQVLFLSFKGGNLRKWLSTEETTLALDTYNDCVDAIVDLVFVEQCCDDLIENNGAVRRIADSIQKDIFTGGISQLASVLARTVDKKVEVAATLDGGSFVESVGDGDSVRFCLPKLKAEFDQLLACLKEQRGNIEEVSERVVDIYLKISPLSYRVMPLPKGKLPI